MDYQFPSLDGVDLVALDTETTGLSFIDDKLFSFSMSIPVVDGPSRDFYWDVRDCPQSLEWLRGELPKLRSVVGMNFKFDLHFLREAGVVLPDHVNVHDTGIYAALLNEHLHQYSLDALAKHYKLPVQKDVEMYSRLAAIFGGPADRKTQMKNISLAAPEDVAKYAMADTATTLALFQAECPKLAEQDLWRVAEMEMQLLPALCRMEEGGVRVDVDAAERAVGTTTTLINTRQRALNEAIGWEINVNSPKQLMKLFQPKNVGGEWYIGDTLIPSTESGNPSIDKDVLMKIQHPAGKMVRGVKTALRIRDTFLLGHVLGSQRNGKVHTTFNQTRTGDDDGGELGTGSGRLSSNGPNLQQISKRDQEAAEIVRALFLPDIDQDWVSRDWSQQDFRVMVHYLNNEKINALYAGDPETDFHTMVANLTGLPRSPKPGIKGNAKAVNLGLSFGMGKGRMAEEMGLPFEKVFRPDGTFWKKAGPEAEEIFVKYHAAVPGIKTMLDNMAEVAKRRGYVRTGFGRRVRFPGGEKAYKAGAMIFQGTAADALKLKIIEVDAILRHTEGRILLNVHDELCQSLPQGPTGRELSERVRVSMETFDGVNCPLMLRTPIRSSEGVGPNWWEASK